MAFGSGSMLSITYETTWDSAALRLPGWLWAIALAGAFALGLQKSSR